jgi:hypothetical protein
MRLLISSKRAGGTELFERDYLMRMIAQSTKALGVIMGLREQNKQEQALEQIDEFLGRELRLKTRFAMGMSDGDLLSMLSVGGVTNVESVAIISAFLQEEAELLSDLGRENESVPRFAKALRLNLWLLRENGGFDGWDVGAKVERLLESLSPYEWDAETKRAVWQWSEAQGRLADAENWLYELQEMSAVSKPEGYAFYERLTSLDDETLLAGGLPRAELEEGRRQWASLTEESAG